MKVSRRSLLSLFASVPIAVAAGIRRPAKAPTPAPTLQKKPVPNYYSIEWPVRRLSRVEGIYCDSLEHWEPLGTTASVWKVER